MTEHALKSYDDLHDPQWVRQGVHLLVRHDGFEPRVSIAPAEIRTITETLRELGEDELETSEVLEAIISTITSLGEEHGLKLRGGSDVRDWRSDAGTYTPERVTQMLQDWGFALA